MTDIDRVGCLVELIRLTEALESVDEGLHHSPAYLDAWWWNHLAANTGWPQV